MVVKHARVIQNATLCEIAIDDISITRWYLGVEYYTIILHASLSAQLHTSLHDVENTP